MSPREALNALLSAVPPPARQIRRCAHDHQMVVVRTVSINPHRGFRVLHLGGVPVVKELEGIQALLREIRERLPRA
jgi:hypothetical protein